MNSKPPGAEPLRPPTSPGAQSSSISRKAGKRPADSTLPSSSIHAMLNSFPVRQSCHIAQRLLELVTCASCSKPYTSPITLPCGHTTCRPCILKRIKAAIAANDQMIGTSRASHVPPRLPLCSITVPCSVTGCPRSAIGQGLGTWAGYSASFGPPEEDINPASSEVSEQDEEYNGQDVGVPPVDGFVVGAENQSLSLGVIPPQLRSKSNTFAMEPFSPDDGERFSELSLRTDVTLAKAVSVIQRFAIGPISTKTSHPAEPARRPWRPVRGFASARRLHSADSSYTSRGIQRSRLRGQSHTLIIDRRSSARPGATPIAPHFRALLGGSEVGRESGAVSSIRAADTDDDEDEDMASTAATHVRRRQSALGRRTSRSFTVMSYEQSADDHQNQVPAGGDTVGLGTDAEFAEVEAECYGEVDKNGEYDDDDDDFGGAFARPRQPMGYGEEAEERRHQAILRKRIQVRHQDPKVSDESEWDTEASASNTSQIMNNHAIGTRKASPSLSSPAREDDTSDAKLFTPEHILFDLTDVLECQLCYLLFYEPITTPCGHTFCRACFARSLDYSSKCPLCRASMPSFAFFQNHPLNHALLRLLTSELGDLQCSQQVLVPKHAPVRRASDAFPVEDLRSLSCCGVFADSHSMATTLVSSPHGVKGHSDWDDSADEDDPDAMSSISFGFRNLYQQRVASAKEEQRQTSDWMPIFVCTLAFPGMPTNLHIFEPRYKLMVRRCMQTSGVSQFGIVLPRRSVDAPQYGTMLEIKSCQMLLDGRSMLETVGGKRFKLLETGSLDGYTTGRVEYINDITPQALAQEEFAVARHNAALEKDGQQGLLEAPTACAPVHERLPTMAGLINSCSAFIDLLRTQTAPGLFEQILATYGPVPQPLEVDRLSWWLGMVLPIDEYAKSSLLPVQSPRKRLEMIVEWINRVQESWVPVT